MPEIFRIFAHEIKNNTIMKLTNLSDEQIIELGQNRSLEEIKNMLSIVRESIRQFFSRLLMDTSADNPKQCRIIISTPEDMGLSELLKPTIIAMYQEPTDGVIYFLFEGCSDYEEFDNFDNDALMQIMEEIEGE